jgi:hypothetical protein
VYEAGFLVVNRVRLGGWQAANVERGFECSFSQEGKAKLILPFCTNSWLAVGQFIYISFCVS